MVYGEMRKEALKWATQFEFGIDPDSMPPQVVITPLKVEECFKQFQATTRNMGLINKRVGSGFMVSKRKKQALFCEGGIGASSFADASYILCHLENVKEILFVGTGGGLGENVESADIHMHSSCIRLDKVLEIFLPLDASAKADVELTKRLKSHVEHEMRDLGIKIHNGIHATVPFFLSETRDLLKNLQKQGALSVDMELLILYALANHFHKKAAGIIRICDLPLKGLPAWKSRSYKRELKDEVHNRILRAILNYIFTP